MNKKLVSMVLYVCALISIVMGLSFFVLNNSTADAAVKTTIRSDCKKITLGIRSDTKYINLSNTKKNAKYTYTSSNTKVVKVSTKDNLSGAYLTGLKAGTAKVTVKQFYKNKTTTVGTVKITVVKSSINDEGVYNLSLGKPIWNFTLATDSYIKNMNYKATYTFSSSDTSILQIKTNGDVANVKKAGKVKVIVKETYKDKTRTVGKIQLTVYNPSLKTQEPVTASTDLQFELSDYINNCTYHVFEVKMTDKDGNESSSYMEQLQWEGFTDWYGSYTCTGKTGTVYLDIYDKTANMDLGILTVNLVAPTE